METVESVPDAHVSPGVGLRVDTRLAVAGFTPASTCPTTARPRRGPLEVVVVDDVTPICGSSNTTVSGERTSRRPLCAVLEIEMDGGCPLTQVEHPARDIYVRQVDGLCRADVIIETDTLEVVHFEKVIEAECVGSIFGRYDCVPHVTEAEAGSITVMTFPPEREMLSDLVQEMRAQNFDVTVKRLISLEDYDQTGRKPPIMCDVSVMTKKEREAVELAVEEGYYDDPNGISLQDLADELGISKSALSSRLSSAESKLMKDMFQRTRR